MVFRIRQPRKLCTLPMHATIMQKPTVQFAKEEFPLKTYMPKVNDIERKWYVVDAEGQVFGRVASQVANILRGKNKPT